MDRVGRNGRLLGKRGSLLDSLDEQAKQRLLEMSGIGDDDDMGEEEKEDLLKALLESNPDFLESLRDQPEVEDNKSVASRSSLNREPTIDVNSGAESIDDNDEDTQPPHQEILDSDQEEVDTTEHDKNKDVRSRTNDMDENTMMHTDSSEDMQAIETDDNDEIAMMRNLRDSQKLAETSSKKDVEAEAGINDTDKADSLEEDSRDDQEEEEETQPYNTGHTLVQETQWTAPDEVASPDQAIPESQSWDSDEDGNTTLVDSRLDKGKHGSVKPDKVIQLIAGKTLLESLWSNLLGPNGDKTLDRDAYTPVVALMLELYLRRLRRHQAKAGVSAPWGKPVEVGRHLEGCLRVKGSGGGVGNRKTDTASSTSRKDRLLRRKGVNQSTKGDDFDCTTYDNDKAAIAQVGSDNSDDFETSAFDSLKRKTEVNVYADVMMVGGSMRKSARICATKMAQQNQDISSDQESDQDGGDWNPGKQKLKPRVRRLGLRANTSKKNLTDNSPAKVKDEDLEQKNLMGFISKERKNNNVKPAANNEEETVTELSLPEDKSNKTAGVLSNKLSKAGKLNSDKNLYHFFSTSDEESIPQNSKILKQKTRAETIDLKKDVILVEDSDNSLKGNEQDDLFYRRFSRQSNKENKREQCEQDLRATNEQSRLKKAMRTLRPISPDFHEGEGKHSNFVSGLADSTSKVKRHSPISSVQLLDEPDTDREEGASTPEGVSEGDKTITADARQGSPVERSPEDPVISSKEANKISQGSTQSETTTPSCRQSSLLDSKGQLYSTQVCQRRPKRNVVHTVSDELDPRPTRSSSAPGTSGSSGGAKVSLRSSRSDVDHKQVEGDTDVVQDKMEVSTAQTDPPQRKRRVTEETGGHSDQEDDSNDSKGTEMRQNDVSDVAEQRKRLKKAANQRSRRQCGAVPGKKRKLDRDDLESPRHSEGSDDEQTKSVGGGLQKTTESVALTKPSTRRSRSELRIATEIEQPQRRSSRKSPTNVIYEEEDGSAVIAEASGERAEGGRSGEPTASSRETPGNVGDNRHTDSFVEEVDEHAPVMCPLCCKNFPLIEIEAHASTCEEVATTDEPENSECTHCKERLPRAALQDHQRRCQGAVAVQPMLRSRRGRHEVL